MPARIGRTNLETFKAYRAGVERDIAQARAPSTGNALAEGLRIVSAWSGRYTRRRDALIGAFGVPPIADAALIERLGARWRARDVAAKGTPRWDRDIAEAVRMTCANMSRMGRVDVATPETPHAFGPSLRALWLAAEARGGDGAACAAAVVAWSRAPSPAWEKIRAVPKARLETPLVWRDMEDPGEPWAATLEGETWRVRINEFPDEPAYGLWSGAKHLGDFHDWPAAWARGGAVAPAPAAKPTAARLAVHIAGAGRLPERFRAGECEAVWRDLTAIGPDVRKAPYAEPAMEVARETMRRARRNVELLVPRLQALGYVFSQPPDAPAGAGGFRLGGSVGAEMMSLDDATRRAETARGLPAGVRDQFLAIFSVLKAAEARPKPSPKPSGGAALKDRNVFMPASAADAGRLARLERRGFVLPLSLRAWLEDVGRVDLTGRHPELCPAAGPLADPLSLVLTAEGVEEEARDWRQDEDPAFPLFVGLDAASKAAATADDIDPDAGYTIAAPQASADAPLNGSPGDMPFVAYLRRAFRNGGFAGWDGAPNRPDALIARLTEGFAPI